MGEGGNAHERRDPELPVDEETDVCCARHKAHNHARHQIADNNQIADRHAKALHRNRRIEENARIRVRELAQRGERHMPPVNVPRAPRLQVQPEPRGQAGPCDHEDAEEDAHLGQRGGHGEEACAEDCLALAASLCVFVGGVLVLARLMTLDIQLAVPVWPTSFLPRPRLLSVRKVYEVIEAEVVDYRRPRSRESVLADMSVGSLGIAE